MAPEIGEQVVVLTGASSGIGRDTALEFARRGAKVVLAARNGEALDTLVGEVERLGGMAVAVPTDVSDYRQLTELASRAVERFGRIDTWVNNASVSTYGTVEQMDVDEIRRVIEVNLLGEIYGMKAALPHLRRTGGTIINISSTLGKRAVALQAAYCAAKHGVIAFGEALRLELRHAKVPVAVVDVLPSSINTRCSSMPDPNSACCPNPSRRSMSHGWSPRPSSGRRSSRCVRSTPDSLGGCWRRPSGSARHWSTGTCWDRGASWTASRLLGPTTAGTTSTSRFRGPAAPPGSSGARRSPPASTPGGWVCTRPGPAWPAG